MELAIERAISERVAVPVRVRCVWMPPSCLARLPDGSDLRIVIGSRDREIEWRLDGALVLVDDLEAYLRDVLVDLGAPQVARCGARIRSVRVDERIECALQNGGRAFAVVRASGKLAIEIELDAVAGQARSEAVTIEREEELLEMSRKLGHTDEEEDD